VRCGRPAGPLGDLARLATRLHEGVRDLAPPIVESAVGASKRQ
jgi:hypothetical protein